MPTQSLNNNKRIAKNTLLLYFRMLLLMGVNLYMSRIILKTLGVVDYGIYNVVAGVITMLGFITGPLGGTASRYVTFALGEGNLNKLKHVFGSTLVVQIIVSAFILVISETLGLWFVMNKLVIPEIRFTAALWIYHFSIFTAIISLLSVPYNAVIIAHEKMDAFAYISIFEALARLGIVFSLEVIPFDHLIIYGGLLMVIQVIVRIMYTVYCKRNFVECKGSVRWNFPLVKELLGYSSWSSLGYLAVVGYSQGLNILLNMFFGPIVNAARGIAVQVQSAILQLCTNFQMALNPQITKSYASGDYEYMHKLIVYASKYSFYIMSLIIVPLLVNIRYVLELWLTNVPDHTVIFLRLTLAIAMLDCMKNPVLNAIHATGKIKFFQTVEGLCLLSIVPIAYLFLRFTTAMPEIVFVVYLSVEILTQVVRLVIILPRIKMDFSPYLKKVILPIGCVTIFLVCIVLLAEPANSFLSLVLSAIEIITLEAIVILVVGINHKERVFLTNHIKSILNKKQR